MTTSSWKRTKTGREDIGPERDERLRISWYEGSEKSCAGSAGHRQRKGTSKQAPAHVLVKIIVQVGVSRKEIQASRLATFATPQFRSKMCVHNNIGKTATIQLGADSRRSPLPFMHSQSHSCSHPWHNNQAKSLNGGSSSSSQPCQLVRLTNQQHAIKPPMRRR